MKYIEAIRTSWQNTQEMPALLRIFCRGGMVAAPILFLFLVLPIAPIKVNGQPVSYADLWSSGIGEILVLFIGLIGIGAWGMAARRGCSRWFVVLAGLLPAVFTTLIPNSSKYAPGIGKADFLAEATITAIFLYACLYMIPSVRRYFKKESSAE